MTADRAHPAAYIRAASGRDADLARHRDAVVEGARQRGWPAPAVYAENESDLAAGRAPALASLEAAIETGRHDAVLITEPGAVYGTATHLLRLLYNCTRHGVVVGFLFPASPAGPRAAEPPATDSRLPGGLRAAGDDAAFPLARNAWGVLARARVEALSDLFPAWRIWLDRHGWHARRRDTAYLQVRLHGAPAFSVHAATPTDLAAQLCWQQAADHHAPGGCSAARPRPGRR